MDKKEINCFFRKDKIFVTPDALDFLYVNQNLVEKVKEECLKNNVFVVDSIFVKNILEKTHFLQPQIKIEYPEIVTDITLEDVITQLKNRFDFLSSLVVQNNQLKEIFSINKIVKTKKDFSGGVVIGMVKDKTTYTFTLEDFSGNIVIRGDSTEVEKLSIDDVVGVEILKEGENFVSKKIYYPSFSFFRKITKLEDEVIISCDKIIYKNKEIMINVESGIKVFVENVKIWVLNFGFLSENVCLLLEKRHWCPSVYRLGKVFKDDFFLIKDIPEYVVVVGADENSKKIYKGVQIYKLKNNTSVYLKEGKFV